MDYFLRLYVFLVFLFGCVFAFFIPPFYTALEIGLKVSAFSPYGFFR